MNKNLKVVLATEPADLRKRSNGLVAIASEGPEGLYPAWKAAREIRTLTTEPRKCTLLGAQNKKAPPKTDRAYRIYLTGNQPSSASSKRSASSAAAQPVPAAVTACR